MTTVMLDSHLVGDLGGTHLRLGLVSDGRVTRTAVHRWSEGAGIDTAVRDFLGTTSARSACLAVAAPVDGTVVRLTNADVSFCSEELRAALGLEALHVVNDLAALARSVTELRDDDAVDLGGGPVRRDRTLVVVAPGTGLGAAALVPHRHGPVVVAGEGGHIPLPATALGLPVAQRLLHLQGHVSAEDLVCGGGLPVLDVVLRILRGEIGARPRTAAEVTSSGDPEVLETFVELLAAIAQSHALTFGAQGGVVLSGGFLRELVPVLRAYGLRDRFLRHPKMSLYLEGIPLVIDTRDHPALVGAARFLEDLA